MSNWCRIGKGQQLTKKNNFGCSLNELCLDITWSAMNEHWAWYDTSIGRLFVQYVLVLVGPSLSQSVVVKRTQITLAKMVTSDCRCHWCFAIQH